VLARTMLFCFVVIMIMIAIMIAIMIVVGFIVAAMMIAVPMAVWLFHIQQLIDLPSGHETPMWICNPCQVLGPGLQI
jgi:hypothetical protein